MNIDSVSINQFDLFLFDLDGTLVNTEELHYQAYRNAFESFCLEIPHSSFTFNEYCRYAHFDDVSMKEFVGKQTVLPYEKIYSKKKEEFLRLLDGNLQFIEGAEALLKYLIQKNIKTAIVTHSDSDILGKILSKIPLLTNITYMITRNDYTNRKPNPECYIKALNHFQDCKNPIGFEDSYKGYISLVRSNVTSVFIGEESYYFFNKIKPQNHFRNFNTIKWESIKPTIENYTNFVDVCLDRYMKSIQLCRKKFIIIIKHIISLIKNYQGNIYLTGIGKSALICRKSVSTWQCLGISCHFLNIPDLFHGEFGILKEDDIIIYISNSGNTDELLKCCQYVKEHFAVLQIGLTIKKDCSLKDLVNFHYSITEDENIYEIDSINMTPTTTSTLFLMLLDMLGVKLGEEQELTVEKFKRNHPGGELGKVQNNIIDYVVIVASGLGSRMFPLTKYIPKILITFKNRPFIQHMIEYWQMYCKKIIIICNSIYNELIKFYCENYFMVKIIHFDDGSPGTADTIHRSIKQEYYGKNILFTWCDILPEAEININQLSQSTIFTYGDECRYGLIDGNRIEKLSNGNGNIIGIYYIKSYRGFPNYTVGDDICDTFTVNYPKFLEYKLYSLIDIGDMMKLRKYNSQLLSLSFQTRFFNEIVKGIDDNTLIKRSLDAQGDEIIKKEINWYRNIKLNNNYTPKIYKFGHNTFEMEQLNAKPIYRVFDELYEDQKLNIISDIIEILDDLHSNKISIEKDILMQDTKIECYDKVYARLNKIGTLIDYFGSIKYVNGIKIDNVDKVLLECYDIIKQYVDTRDIYSFIHGDCQFSNMLIDNTNNQNKIYLIDPRGYFGKTLLYGLPEYDFSKVLYALSGYDKFNNNQEYYIENISNDCMELKIQHNLDLIGKLPSKICNRCTLALTVIHWIALAQYNRNDVMKCSTSYYYGLYLHAKYMKNLNDIDQILNN
ncbi:unnamed protein product [Rotaria sp. Silwood1]|nr:unnamed protein product [Rotaria sp. Silwood1]